MRIFKTKIFHQWTKKVGLRNITLKQAIDEMLSGKYEASLGGHLYKKRVAIGSKGKRGGLRTIIAFKKENNVFFVYGFAKNTRTNIKENESKALKALSKIYFSYNENQLKEAVKVKELIEVL